MKNISPKTIPTFKVFSKTLKLQAMDFERLVEQTKQTKIVDSSSASKTGNQDMEKIVDKISKDRKIEKHDALVAVAAISQLGGTANKASGDKVKVTIDPDIEISLQLVWKVVKEVTGNSLRRIAKTYPTLFKQIAQNKNIQGNQLNKIRTNYPDFKLIEEDDKFWVSDFQTENPECPEYIWQQLSKYYQEFVTKNDKNKW